MKKLGVLFIALFVFLPACGSATTTPQTTVTANPKTTATVKPNTTASSNANVAAPMAAMLLDMELVHKYYSDGVDAIAQFKPGSSTTAGVSYRETGKFTVQFASVSSLPRNSVVTTPVTSSRIPKEFQSRLPGNGGMSAPAGACPAGASPTVTFKTAGGKSVTPDLIAEKAIKAIPSELLTMDQNSPGSLTSLVETAVQSSDRSLATPQGWNTLLWDKVKAQQTTPQSLMDYQLWNASSDLEQQITDLYLQRVVASGAPDMVVNAFKASATSGWYTSTQPTAQDALAGMEIEAVMSGSINGTVHEQRDFSIKGAGQTPTYGIQTGAGSVTWNHPELGEMHFKVDIKLDKFDEMGRAIGGTTIGVDAEKGYEIKFTFNPDGTKKGELFKDGTSVGLLTMTVNADKFENYVDVKTNQSEPLPEVNLK